MVDVMTRNQLSPHQRTLEALGQPDFFKHTGFGYGVHLVFERRRPLFAAVGGDELGRYLRYAWRSDPANRLISLFFTQDFADTSSGPDRRAPGEPTPAAQLQAGVEQLAWDALANRQGPPTGG